MKELFNETVQLIGIINRRKQGLVNIPLSKKIGNAQKLRVYHNPTEIWFGDDQIEMSELFYESKELITIQDLSYIYWFKRENTRWIKCFQ